MAWWMKLLDAVLAILPEWVRRAWAKADEQAKEIERAENELRDALLSGDVDRITIARRVLWRLQK